MKKMLASGSLAVWLAVGAFGIAFTAAPASASTVIDFGSGTGDDPYIENGFSFSPDRIVGGPCDLGSPCQALNNNQIREMTYINGAFDLLGLSFYLNGRGTGAGEGNELKVFETGDDSNSISFSVADFLKNTWHTISFADFGSQFLSVTSITFLASLGANVRIDNVIATCDGCPNESVPNIPLPAALPLLLGGLGGLAWLSRSRKRRDLTAA